MHAFPECEGWNMSLSNVRYRLPNIAYILYFFLGNESQ